MFKNRAIQVKMVKDDGQAMAEATPTEDVYINRLAKAKEVTVDLMREGAKLCAGYVVLDTARKVLIAKANQ